jgi:DNA helicase TIP49 (TBP-interacting protein)
MTGMAQTLGSDVPFVMLTASEVFSLEVSWSSGWTEAKLNRADIKNRVLDSGVQKIYRCADKGGD